MKLQSRFLLDAAVLSIGIFEAQTQFGFVAFQVEQLLGVKGSATPPGDKMRFCSKQEEAENVTWLQRRTVSTLTV